MRNRNQSGFTLVEVTIILLVLVLLSTIMLPQLGNYNRLARFVKVTEDLGALCAEMKKMLDESMEGAFWGNPKTKEKPIGLLFGTGSFPKVQKVGYADTNWDNDGLGYTAGGLLLRPLLTDVDPDIVFADSLWADSFYNHLQNNTPFDGGWYDTNADFGDFAKEWWAMGWSGPYFNKIEPDPWGNMYLSNAAMLHSDSAGNYFLGPTIVISAGPNETIETPFDMYPVHISKGPVGGDDMVCVLSAGGPM
jgi:type II secretory pathway pseudopilin PulG